MNARRTFTLAFSLAVLAFAMGCGGGGSDPEALVTQGFDSLGRGDFAAAHAQFDKALDALGPSGGDPDLVFRAKYGLIQAKIRTGEADDAKDEFLALPAAFPGKLTSKEYRNVAGSLSGGDENLLAIEILDAAIQAFPDQKPALEADIEAIRQKPDLDPEAMEKLKKLGYVK